MCTQVPFPGKSGHRKVGLVVTQISLCYTAGTWLAFALRWDCKRALNVKNTDKWQHSPALVIESGGTSFRGFVCRQGHEITIGCLNTQWKDIHLQRVSHLTYFLCTLLAPNYMIALSVSDQKGWTFETHEDLSGDLAYCEADKEIFVWSTCFGFNPRLLQRFAGCCRCPDPFGCKQQYGVLGPLLLRTSFSSFFPACFLQTKINL